MCASENCMSPIRKSKPSPYTFVMTCISSVGFVLIDLHYFPVGAELMLVKPLLFFYRQTLQSLHWTFQGLDSLKESMSP